MQSICIRKLNKYNNISPPFYLKFQIKCRLCDCCQTVILKRKKNYFFFVKNVFFFPSFFQIMSEDTFLLIGFIFPTCITLCVISICEFSGSRKWTKNRQNRFIVASRCNFQPSKSFSWGATRLCNGPLVRQHSLGYLSLSFIFGKHLQFLAHNLFWILIQKLR